MTFGENETRLSDWMQENAFVCWIAEEKPWQVETELIKQLSLPLNIQQNKQHAFYPLLTRIRKEAKTKAKSLPIVRKIPGMLDDPEAKDQIAAYSFDTMGNKMSSLEYMQRFHSEIPKGETRESMEKLHLDMMKADMEKEREERQVAIAKWKAEEQNKEQSDQKG